MKISIRFLVITDMLETLQEVVRIINKILISIEENKLVLKLFFSVLFLDK